MKPQLRTLEEVLESYLKKSQHFRDHNRIDSGNTLILDVYEGRSGTYDVDLDRIATPIQLLGWISHLGQKTWMEKDRLIEIMELIAEWKGWDIKP